MGKEPTECLLCRTTVDQIGGYCYEYEANVLDFTGLSFEQCQCSRLNDNILTRYVMLILIFLMLYFNIRPSFLPFVYLSTGRAEFKFGPGRPMFFTEHHF